MEEVTRLLSVLAQPQFTLAEKNQAFGDIVTRFQDMAYGCAYAILGTVGWLKRPLRKLLLSFGSIEHSYARQRLLPDGFAVS